MTEIEEMEKTVGSVGLDAVAASADLGLPLPRIQLTWFKGDDTSWYCRLDFLIPVGRYDIRNLREKGFVAAKCGFTRSRPGRSSWTPKSESGEIDTPFRDGAHAAWDSKRLGWPAFVVYGESFQRIEAKSDE